MSVFQSFQTGLALGKQQKRDRDMAEARSAAGDLFKSGNYEGAETLLMSSGLMDEANAYASAGSRRKAAEDRKALGEAYKEGGWEGVSSAAGERGDLQTVATAETAAHAGKTREWEERNQKILEHKQGVEFLATEAGRLKALPLEQRGAAAMQAIENSPFAGNPEIIAAIERAAADGKIDDNELTAFQEQMLTYAQKLDVEYRNKTFENTLSQQEQAQANWEAEQRARNAPDPGKWQSAGDGVIFNTVTGETMGGSMMPQHYGATGTFDANTGMDNPFQNMEMYDQGGKLYQVDFGGQGFDGGGQGYQPPQPAGRKPTDFDKTQDREMAKDIADWKTTGQATALTSLAKLRDVIEELEDPDSRRGGAYMAMMPEGVKPLLAPNTVNTKEMAESVVQSSLKAVLGGQFAQKEADALFARTYNPALSDEVNAERLKRLYNEMVNRAAINETAARYADQYGTLQGFEGYLPGLQDFMMGEAEPTSGAAESTQTQGGVVRIQDAQGYASLPSGTTYIAPDGTTRRKP